MKEQIANHFYQEFLRANNENLKTLEKHIEVNDFLKSNDWLFISPIYFQGYELESILKLSKTKKDEKLNILYITYRKFYDLRYTASFIEGYCARCNYIKPFLNSIEHSLILCFQKDYEGSIKTIIPIIEGILRKYLITEKGFSNERIRSNDLKNSFDKIRLDLIQGYEIYLRTYKTNNHEEVTFSKKQIKDLTQKEAAYFNVWFSFVSDFVQNSFYLNTNGNPITNEVNRHSILHEFGFDFEYNFENYVKVYFLLQFLTWAFLLKEGKSILNQIETYRFFEKIVAYERIIKRSEKLIYDKHILFKNYEKHVDHILKQQFPTFKNNLLPKKHLFIHKLLRKIEELKWRGNMII